MPANASNSNKRDLDSSRSRAIPTWRKALFGALVTLAFFALLEGLAALAGVEPALYAQDPYVGFARHLPLFVEDEEAGSGVLRTAPNKESYFNPQRFPRAKAPGEYRIFALGGSTTYGRPYYGDVVSFPAWLRALLPEADASKTWQVINAGGISYASYRAALLMEELANYEPDLFIIYTGHNEFLERRTYADLIDVPAPTSRLVAFASRSRAFSALRDWVSDLRAASRASQQGAAREDVESDSPVLAAEVEVMLDRAVGPSDYTRDEKWWGQVYDHFRFNLGRMVEIAASADARVLFVVPGSNLAACSPFKSEFAEATPPAERDAIRRALKRASRARIDGAYDEALGLLDDALAEDDRYAHLHYQRGLVLEALGRTAEARDALIRAADEDVCPLRATSVVRSTIRAVAAERNTWLLDFAAVLEADAADEIPGEQYFLDHVHLDIPTYRRLALELIEFLRGEGIVGGEGPIDAATLAAVSERVEAGVDVEAQARAMRNLARVFAWAGKYEDSTRAARRSVQLYAGDYEPHLLIGRNAMKLNRPGIAVRALGRAIKLIPEEAGPRVLLGMQLLALDRHAEAVEQLREANRLKPGDHATEAALARGLSETGQHAEAIELIRRATNARKRSPAAHTELAEVLRRAGDEDGALESFERALTLDASYEPAVLPLVALRAKREGVVNALERLDVFLALNPSAREALAYRVQLERIAPERSGESAPTP